ncbi:hypothetical protein CK203_110666 [Vitis vinifera]|uniref:Uncharacterized protein n=1 Tax=Vitis vinifera TaxID=29760 RepID=A0A438D929_VITVI|nr:hypothetical protein CK203_110666 [Vitis vinifera]
MLVTHIGKLQENPAALCKMAAKLSGRFPDVIHPGGKWRQPISGCDTSGWKVAAAGWNGGGSRFPDVIHPGGKWRQSDGKAFSSRMEFLPGWNVQDPILLVFWICLRIPKNSPQSGIALVIKKAIKTPKLNTI